MPYSFGLRCSERGTKAYGFLFAVPGLRGGGVRGHGTAELAAQIEGGVVEILSADRGPQVEGIAMGAALEAVEGARREVGRERATGRRPRAMHRAGAAVL